MAFATAIGIKGESMSPTLLEGFVVLILILVAWQIGVQLAPHILGGIKQAADQLDESSQEIEKMIEKAESSSNQELNHDNKQS